MLLYATYTTKHITCIIIPILVLGFWDSEIRYMCGRHAISPGLSGHYLNVDISSRTVHGFACNLRITSLQEGRIDPKLTICPKTMSSRVSVWSSPLAWILVNQSYCGCSVYDGFLEIN